MRKFKCKLLAYLLTVAMIFQFIGADPIVVFAEGPQNEDIQNPFADVFPTDWYYPYVSYALENNIVAGKGRDENGLVIFDPNSGITRSEFVQILYSKEGKPETEFNDKFSDVHEEDWFAKAISWAADNGIVAGKGAIFDTYSKITREEIATVLCSYAKNYLKYETSGRGDLSVFEDADKVSSWAVPYMEWAVYYGIMKGKGAIIDPTASATRAEAVTMIKSFITTYADLMDQDDDEKHDYLDGSAVISVEGFETEDYISTDLEKITLQGMVHCDDEIAEVSCKVYSSSDETKKKYTVNGTTQWSIDEIPLDIGTNYIDIIAKTAKGEEYLKEVLVRRNCTEIKLADNVVAFNVEDDKQLQEVKEIYDQIITLWRDDQGTEDTSDDEICILVKETNPLLGHIKSGAIKQGDIIFIPENDYFVAGFSQIYLSHDDRYSDEYVTGYDAAKFEVIHTLSASWMDMIEGDFAFESSEFDINDPVAFVYNPYAGADEKGEEPDVLTAVSKPGQTVERPGLQYQNLAKISPKVQISGDLKSIDLSTDIIVFDKDGNKDTEHDRINLEGSINISNIGTVFDVEWPSNSKLPKQVISTLEYTESDRVKVSFGSGLAENTTQDLSDMGKIDLSNSNYTFDNKREGLLFGIIKELEGVDTENTLILGAVGFHTGGWTSGMTTIAQESIVMKINPIIVVPLILDMQGELKIDASVEYKETAYVKKGLNVQEENFKGKHGTVYQNTGTQNYVINAGGSGEKYHLNLYNVRQKTKSDSGNPEKEVTIQAEGTAEQFTGLGWGAGVMIFGIMPFLFKATVGPYLKLKANGQINICNYQHGNSTRFGDAYVTMTGDFELSMKVQIRLDAQVRFVAKTSWKNYELTYDADIAKIDVLSLVDLSSASKGGYVYEEDYDDNDKNDKPLQGATVKLKRNSTYNTTEFTTVTDKNGYYEFAWFRGSNIGASDDTLSAQGAYTLTISKSGYETYKDTNYSVQKETHWDPDVFRLEKGYGTVFDTVTFNKDTDLRTDNPYENCHIKTLIIENDGMKYNDGKSPMDGSRIDEVIVEDGVTVIPDYLFSNVVIKKITLPDSVTEICGRAFTSAKLPKEFEIGNCIKKIGAAAFSNSTLNASSIVITKGTTIENGAFNNVVLEEVVLSSTENVVLTSAFSGATIGKLMISDGVTVIPKEAFKKADIMEFVMPEQITEIQKSAFYDAQLPENFTIGTKGLTVGEYAFTYAKPEFAKVVLEEEMTVGRAAFGNIEIKEIVMNDVKSVGENPFGYSVIGKVSFSDEVTKIPAQLFKWTTINELKIPDQVTTVGDEAFFATKSSNGFALGKGITKIGQKAFWASDVQSSKYVIEEGTSIGSEAFGKVTVGEIVLNSDIDVRLYNAFNGTTIEKVSITENAQKITMGVFASSIIHRIEIPGHVTLIDSQAFENAMLPSGFTVPEGVEQAEDAFTNVTYVDFDN